MALRQAQDADSRRILITGGSSSGKSRYAESIFAFADRDLDSAAMSPLRLRRLLQAREPDDLLRQMRRLVDLAGDPLDVGALATLILDWFDEERGDRVRTLFAYDYYAAGGDPPGASPATPTA